MIPAPDGAVTLVFVDSSAPLEPAAARLGAHRGYEVKRSDERLMAAFASAGDAARFALDVLGGGEALRIGVHTGDPIRENDPATGRADYFGPAVNRAARIAEAAHAGQAVFSGPALVAAGDAILGADVVPLGEHRMKGLERPEPLFQILPGALKGRAFGPLRTLTALPTNLPVQTTSFVGRERELRELESIFGGGARLVTLTGPAGVGKTRLAVRLGAELLGRFAGGCWFADLGEAGTAGDGGTALAGLVAQSLGIAVGGGAAADQVAGVLSARRSLLLILDTWDVARAGASEALALWLARAPEVRVLVTGRSLTGLAGEKEFRVDPFPVPARGRPEDAMRLFVERAREAKPEYAPSAESDEDVAAICRELEGIPLAIELAAARVKIMQPAMMRKKLGQKFQLLKSARQDGAQRQQTLAGAIEWGLETLTPEERRVFLRLSVFRGGFIADIAAQVVGPEATPARIEALRARSLLAARDYPWGRRYLLYRLIHEYAGREWQASSTPEERMVLDRRHAEVALEYFRSWERKSVTSADRESVDRLEAAIENIAAVQERALARAAAASAPEAAAVELGIAARAADSLSFPYSVRGSAADWLARIEPAVRAVQASPAAAALMDPEALAGLLCTAADATRSRGDNARATALATQAVAVAESRPASLTLSRALRILAWQDAIGGRFAPALAALDRAEAIARAADDRPALSDILNARGIALRRGGDALGALEAFREAVRLAEEAGALSQGPAFAMNAGTTCEMIGRLDEAIAWYERAERGAESIGRPNAIAINLANRANLLSRRGDHEAALAMFDRAAAMIRELGRPALIAALLAMRSGALGRAGRPADALAASEAAEKLYAEIGDRALQATTLGERMPILKALGDVEGALAAGRRSAEIFEAMGNRPSLLQVTSTWAALMREAGRGADARAGLRRALADRTGASPPVVFEALAALAVCEEAAGDLVAAKDAAREGLAVLGGVDWQKTLRPDSMAGHEAEVLRILGTA